jgi:hypothetical protein
MMRPNLLIMALLLICVVLAQEQPYGEMDYGQKQEYLTSIGLSATPDDVSISGQQITVNAPWELDVSQLQGTYLIKLTGPTDLVDSTKRLRVSDGAGNIMVKDGQIFIADGVRLYEGSVVNEHKISGSVKGLTNGIVEAMPGKILKIDDSVFIPQSGSGFIYSLKDSMISTNGNTVSIGDNIGNTFAYLAGTAKLYSNGEIALIASPGKPTEFWYKDGPFIRTIENTLITVDPPQTPKFSGSIISFNKDTVHVTGINNNVLSLRIPDGYEKEIFIDKISDNTKVFLTLTGEYEDVHLDFSKGAPVSRGDLSTINTRVGNVFTDLDLLESYIYSSPKGTDWMMMVYNGGQYTGKFDGMAASNVAELARALSASDRLAIIDSIADSNYDYADLLTFYSQSEKNPEVQRAVLDRVESMQPQEASDLMKLTKDPGVQMQLLKRTQVNQMNSENLLASLSSASSADVRRYLLDNNAEEFDNTMLWLLRDAFNTKLEEDVTNRIMERIPNEHIRRALSFDYLDDRAKKEAIQNMPDNNPALLLAFTKSKGSDEIQAAIIEKLSDTPLPAFDAVEMLIQTESSQLRSQILSRHIGGMNENEFIIALKYCEDDSLQKQLAAHSKGMDVTKFWDEYQQATNDEGKPLYFSLEARKDLVLNSEPQTVPRELVRSVILNNHDDSIVPDLLSKSSLIEGTENEETENAIIKVLYSEPKYLSKLEGLEPQEKWSVTQAISRHARETESYTMDDMLRSTDIVLESREKYAEKVLLGPGVTFIPIMHNEKNSLWTFQFNEQNLRNFAMDSGVQESNIVPGLMGPTAKLAIIDAISGSSGPTTVYFDGHGSEDTLELGYALFNSDEGDPGSIDFKEMGNALLKRQERGQSLSEFALMLDACNTYDFAQKLYSYLQENGAKELPIIATMSNRGQLGYSIGYDKTKAQESGIYSEALYYLKDTKAPGRPLTLRDVYKADRSEKQDAAVFVPSGNSYLSIGSSHDEELPVRVSPQKQHAREGEPEELPTKKSTVNVIEISSINNKEEAVA